MGITFVPSDLWGNLSGVVQECAPDHIVKCMGAALTADAEPDVEALSARQHPFYAEVYYGPWSSESPLLSFACLRDGDGEGIFVSVNTGGRTYVYVNADGPEADGPEADETEADGPDSASEVYRVQWGQDEVAIPRALTVSTGTAERITRHFCGTGTLTSDPNWRDLYHETTFDLYDVE